jgi:hypothetical protein
MFVSALRVMAEVACANFTVLPLSLLDPTAEQSALPLGEKSRVKTTYY